MRYNLIFEGGVVGGGGGLLVWMRFGASTPKQDVKDVSDSHLK